MELPAPITFLLFFGAVFILNMALGRLWVRPFNDFQKTTAALLAVTGAFQFLYACYVAGITREYPHLAMLHVPLLLAEGPLLYFYFHHLIENEPYRGRRLLHALAPATSVLLLLPFFLLPGDSKRIFLENAASPSTTDLNMIFQAARLMLPAAFISILIYLGILLRKYHFLFRGAFNPQERPLLRLSLGLILMVGLCGLVGMVGQLVDVRLKTLGSLAASSAFLVLYHVSQRRPEFLASLRLEIKKARYAISHLGGVDPQAVLRDLRAYMEKEHPYRDEDCSLESMSREIALKPAQLTELLNVHAGETFYEFLNRYRIAAAEKMLLNEPDEPVLKIAYACGFNSKSSFYNSFRKLKGTSPARFRERATAPGADANTDADTDASV